MVEAEVPFCCSAIVEHAEHSEVRMAILSQRPTPTSTLIGHTGSIKILNITPGSTALTMAHMKTPFKTPDHPEQLCSAP